MFAIGTNSLEFAHIRHSDGPKTIVWLFDSNISYHAGKHIPLFVLGLMFCSFALVYTMILLFIQCLQRRSNICYLRWVDRWRPFFEAYTSPCHVNYRFWPRFLFFTQLTLSTFGSVLRTKPTVNLHIITAACVVILILAFVSPTGVYKHWPLNVLEFSFLINLGILSTLVATVLSLLRTPCLIFCVSFSGYSNGSLCLYYLVPLYTETHVLQLLSKICTVSCRKKSKIPWLKTV